jgi:hypothetical protein
MHADGGSKSANGHQLYQYQAASITRDVTGGAFDETVDEMINMEDIPCSLYYATFARADQL